MEENTIYVLLLRGGLIANKYSLEILEESLVDCIMIAVIFLLW